MRFGQGVDVRADGDVAQCAADGDGEADGGGGADGVAYRYVAPDEEGHDDGAAADGDQAAEPAGERAGERHACQAGQLARSVRTLVDQDLCRGEIDEQREEDAQSACGNMRGKQGAQCGAEQDAGRDMAHDLPVHRAVLVVFAHAGHGREYDGRHGGAEREMHRVFGGEVLRIEHQQQHGHQHQSAADAEQSGQKSGNRAGNQIGRDTIPSVLAPVSS